MKLSKVLSLVLAIAMLLSVPTFAFPDVDANASYAEAVTVLSALNIINGYEDGTFKPEGKITRAEYAAIVCRANNMDDAAKANKVGGIFTDVPADHWASGYIATAYQAGIINGMGDGTFAPEAEVTYEQAVKMLVAALGYELKAQSMGGYPTGYMMIANQESITVGTTNTAGGAARATVARLTYNALTVPMMDQTAWGTNVEFKPIKTQSLLYTKLNAIKAEVTIADSTNLDKTATDVTLKYASVDSVAKENGISIKTDKDAGTAKTNVKKNGVDLNGLQGLKVTAIIDKSDDSAWKLICIVPKAGKNVEIVVDPKMMSEVNPDDGYVEYYKTNDDTNATKIKVKKVAALVDSLTIYKNLVKGVATDVKAGGNVGDIAYRFVDTDNDGTFDTVFVDNVAIFAVGNVNTANGKIYRDTSSSAMSINASGSYALDADKDTLSWAITDAEGNPLTIDDIKAGDVIVLAESKDDNNNIFYDIKVVRSTIEGTVTQTFKETPKVGTTPLNKYTIGGKDYTLLNDGGSIKPGDEIIAKVYGNQIVSYEVAEGIQNYGMIVATNLSSDFGDTYQLQILTQKGEIVTLNLAEKVNGVTVSYVDTTAGTPPVVTSTAAQNLAADFPKGDIIAYNLNASGELKTYDIQTGFIPTSANVLKSTDKFTTGTVQWKATSEKLGSYNITDSTVVFTTEDTLANITKTNVALSSKDILAEDTPYNAAILYNENKEAEVVVLIQAANQVNTNSYPLVITKTATVTIDGDSRTKFFGYVNGEDVELIVSDKAGADVTGLAINDIAFFATNAVGEIIKAIPLATYTSGTGFVVYDNAIAGAADDAKTAVAGNWVTLKTNDYGTITTAAAAQSAANGLMAKGGVASNSALKGFGVAGKLYKVSGNNFRVMNADNYKLTFNGTATRNYDTTTVVDGRINDYTVNANAVAYKFNATTGKYSVTTLLDADTDVNTVDYQNGAQLDNDDLVYAFNYDGETKLVLIIDVKGTK